MASQVQGKCMKSDLSCYAVRLGPGEELLSSLLMFVKDNGLRAAFIITCVGSVQKAKLRLFQAAADDRNHVLMLDTKHEIVSLVGTLSGGGHVHASLADERGTVVGGHVLGDMIVHTTAEVVIGDCTQLVFSREMDNKTGFNELVIK